jgi:threonyl-tRNA synthetase
MKNPLKKNVNLEHLRHSLAHLMAQAVLELYPDALPSIGPAIENGFYYDFEFKKPISDADLSHIEKKMRELLPKWTEFTHREIDTTEARGRFSANPFKLELVEEILNKKEPTTLYTCGGFTDLCRGGHLDNPAKEIKSDTFKLTHIAGAYWRGNENNPMLTRIYGLAFHTKKELDAHLVMLEEAKKRDHRKLGKELDLFLFSDLVGAGLPMFTPKGTLVRNLLDTFVWELREQKGYERVDIPHLTKKDLYVTSGHWDKFGDELFKITTREKHEFVVKPMNCPHHTQIFDRRKWSYRDMPQRYASTTKVYRDEQSGELGGLTRVRSITQDDAHVFCRYAQVAEEVEAIWDIIDTFYKTLNFELKPTLSIHDPKKPEEYLGTPEVWERSVSELRDIAKKRKIKLEEFEGEAAFYGPKIDFLAKDSIGREHQVATMQIDMNMPERFNLNCTAEDGKEERVVMIHAAIMGSIERFMAPYIEHTAGNFPLWLSPVQIKVLPISEKHKPFSQNITEELKKAGIRVELDDSDETLGKKIRNWKLEKIPYSLVIGDEEVKSKKVKLESRDGKKASMFSTEKLIEQLKKEIADRK